MIFLIDENGYFIGDEFIENLPYYENTVSFVTERPMQPCYKPRWNGEEWVDEGVKIEGGLL